LRISFVLLAAWSLQAVAAPVAVVCNGTAVDAVTGWPVPGPAIVFAFEFDQAKQTMAVTQGAPARLELAAVHISDSMAKGFQPGRWRFEVDRITATAAVYADDAQSQRLGATGAYFRGACAPAGKAQF